MPAVLRASAAIERAGIPTVAVIGRVWQRQAEVNASYLNLPDLPMAVFQTDLMRDGAAWDEEELHGTLSDQIVSGLTGTVASSAAAGTEPAPREIVATGTFDEINQFFDERLWGDGYPVVPPTLARVDAMLEHTDRDPDEVLGILPAELRQLTVWSVAVSGVMAGCKPEHLPVLLAAAECLADPEYRIEDFGTAPSWEPLLIVSGPVIDHLGFNAGAAAMRPGRRANTAIGRALRLLCTNVAGFRTETGSDLAGFGNPINVALAEDEQTVREIGWATYGEERGLAAGESGVTLMGVIGTSPPTLQTYYGPDASIRTDLEPLVDVFGRGMCGWWTFTGAVFGRWHPLVVISPGFARKMAAEGFGKDDLRQHLYDECRTTAAKLERDGEFIGIDIAKNVKAGILPATYLESDDPQRSVPIFVRPDWIGVVVAGGDVVSLQRGLMNNHQQGAPVTRRIR